MRDIIDIINKFLTENSGAIDTETNMALWINAKNFAFHDVTKTNHTIAAMEYLNVPRSLYDPNDGALCEPVLHYAMKRSWVRMQWNASRGMLFLQGERKDTHSVGKRLIDLGFEPKEVILEYIDGGSDTLSSGQIGWWARTGRSPSQMSRMAMFREEENKGD